MYRVITDEHINYIKSHPEMTDPQIGKALNINASTIRATRHKLGIYKDRSINISKEDFLKSYIEHGKNLSLTAEALGTNRHTLKKIANSYGIKTDKKLNLSKNDIANICANYQNSTAKELSIKYKCSVSMITKIWAEHNYSGKTKRNYHLDESYFDEINTPAKAYFVGLIASDGCLFATENANKSSIIKVSISDIDEKILKLFRQELQTDKPLMYHTKNNSRYVTIEICSNALAESLVRIGITPIRKTYGNTIPNIRDDLMPHFIRGYFDGDGSVPKSWLGLKDNRVPKFNASISGFKCNMDKLINYLESKNIYSSFIVDNRHNYMNDDFGSLSLSNIISTYCFLKLIYKDCEEFCLDRKRDIANNIINFVENNNNARYKQAVNYYKYAVQIMC